MKFAHLNKGSSAAENLLALKSQKSLTPEEAEALKKFRCPTATLAIFSRQLSLMMASGIQLTHALDVLSIQQEEPKFGEIIGAISDQLIAGQSLSRAISAYPLVFNRVYIAMVKIGEETGGLSSTLDRLATWQEKDYALYRQTKAALTYPAFILILSFTIFLLIFRYVLPGFLESFSGLADTPMITRLLIVLSDMTRNPWVCLFGLAALIGGTRWLRNFASQKEGALVLFKLGMTVPLVGDFLRSSSIARYSGALCTMLSSGVDLLKATAIAATASGSPILEDDADAMGHSISQGGLISEHMKEDPDIYPNALRTMIAAGEESSEVSGMLTRASEFYEADATARIELFSVMIEPILMAIVALVVGFIVIAIFLPMYSVLGELA